MKKILTVLAISLSIPAVSTADNVGGCGWGSKLFDGQKGIFPQVLAVTTNGTSGNQTFGITSGTSGCSQDGVVKSTWKTAAFVDGNMNRLALDISRGQGESLASLKTLLGVSASDSAVFDNTLQSQFSKIFTNSSVSSNSVLEGLKEVLASNPALAKYSVNL